MFKMSFSRYKALLRLAQNSSRNLEYEPKIALRLYSTKVILTSASPHEFGSEQKERLRRRVPKDPFDESEFQEIRPRPQYKSEYKKKLKEQKRAKYQSRKHDSGVEHGGMSRKENSFKKFNHTEHMRPKYEQQIRKNYEHRSHSAYQSEDPHNLEIEHNESFARKITKSKYAPIDFEEESPGPISDEKLVKDYRNTIQSKYLGKLNKRKNIQHFESKDSATKKFTFQSNLEFPEEEKLDDSILDINHETEMDDLNIIPKNQKQRKLNYKLIDNPQYQEELSFDKEDTNFENEQLQEERTIVKLEPDYNIVNTNNLTVLSPDESGNAPNKILSKYKILETSRGDIKYDLSTDEFNPNEFVKEMFNVPEPLDECQEDLSSFGPDLSPTFNFAAYADKSKLIQAYVKLGVKLYKLEKNHDHMRVLLSMDLEKELPEVLRFLHDCGVPADCLGDVISENPMILKEDIDDMKTRIRYLRAHKFAIGSIARIVTKNPFWLTWATKHIDERLGHFQNEFKLGGNDIRFLATKQPKLITYNMKFIHENTFAVREQMGFNKQEIKIILLSRPRLWMNNRNKIVDSFDYLHNHMNLSHRAIASQPEVLSCRKCRVKNRHEFLVELKKDQYDPKKPGYISPSKALMGSDEEFCRDVAKTAVETYNLFLKTR